VHPPGDRTPSDGGLEAVRRREAVEEGDMEYLQEMTNSVEKAKLDAQFERDIRAASKPPCVKSPFTHRHHKYLVVRLLQIGPPFFWQQ